MYLGLFKAFFFELSHLLGLFNIFFDLFRELLILSPIILSMATTAVTLLVSGLL